MKQSSHSGASLPENDHAGIVADDARPSLWKTTDYGPWLVADTSGTLGASMAGFAIPLIVLAVTGSAAQASLVSAVQSCVSAATNIPGGLLQDRCDRRMLLLIWSATGVLLFGGAGLLGRMGWLGVAGLMVLAILPAFRPAGQHLERDAARRRSRQGTGSRNVVQQRPGRRDQPGQ